MAASLAENVRAIGSAATPARKMASQVTATRTSFAEPHNPSPRRPPPHTSPIGPRDITAVATAALTIKTKGVGSLASKRTFRPRRSCSQRRPAASSE